MVDLGYEEILQLILSARAFGLGFVRRAWVIPETWEVAASMGSEVFCLRSHFHLVNSALDKDLDSNWLALCTWQTCCILWCYFIELHFNFAVLN